LLNTLSSALLGHFGRREDTPTKYRLKILTLAFVDPEVERTFVDDNLNKSLPLIRLSLFFASVLYAGFGFLDYHMVGDQLAEVLSIRLGIVCPFMLTVIAISFYRNFGNVAQALLSLSMLFCGLGVVVMTAITTWPANVFYYAGLIMVVIYGSTLVRLKFKNSVAVSVTSVTAYQIVAVYINPIPPSTLLSNNFFLFMASAVGIFATYIQELYIRRAYVYTQLLTEEKERSEYLLREAQAASHAKSEFLAVVSHELRTPLNAIIGFSEFLKMEMFGPIGSARYKSYAEDIHSSGKHLLEVISDILDLSKAEANKLDVIEEEVHLRAAVNSCMRMLQSRATEGGVRLSTQVPSWALLRADERLVKQAIINLVNNAIKFTPSGGEVSVSVKCEDDGACAVSIHDTGIGIAEKDIPKVLEPFGQVESSHVRSHEGLGLGLPLVKKIIELHSGSLQIESRLGSGTTVTIRFPPERVLRWEAEQAEWPELSAAG
jgi:signal transduction histidine kinase